MRDDDVRGLLGSAVDDVLPESAVDLDAAVAGGLGLRRRRTRRRGLAGVAAVVVAIVGVSGGVALLDRDPAPPSAPVASAPAPDAPTVTAQMAHLAETKVRCTPNGIELSAASVVASSDGVTLAVSSTMPPGTYLTYASDGGGVSGGDRLPRRADNWTLALAPGTVELSCFDPGEDDPGVPVELEVTDPHGFWRGESLEAVGCSSGGSTPSWKAGLDGSGATAEEAVQGVLDAFTELDRERGETSAYDALPGDIGYLDDPVQTWVATKIGEAYLTVLVTEGWEQFTAYPDAYCG